MYDVICKMAVQTGKTLQSHFINTYNNLSVLGKVPSEELGVVLPHEHILVDYTTGLDTTTSFLNGRDVAGLPVTMENLGFTRRFMYVRNNQTIVVTSYSQTTTRL